MKAHAGNRTTRQVACPTVLPKIPSRCVSCEQRARKIIYEPYFPISDTKKNLLYLDALPVIVAKAGKTALSSASRGQGKRDWNI